MGGTESTRRAANGARYVLRFLLRATTVFEGIGVVFEVAEACKTAVAVVAADALGLAPGSLVASSRCPSAAGCERGTS